MKVFWSQWQSPYFNISGGVSSKVGSNISRKLRIEDYLHSDVMEPHTLSVRLSLNK